MLLSPEQVQRLIARNQGLEAGASELRTAMDLARETNTAMAAKKAACERTIETLARACMAGWWGC